MTRKLPPEAYAFYLGLGHARSYQAVATRFGVSKRTVTKRAIKEDWQSKVKLADDTARTKAEERVQETLAEMNERHLKTMQLVQKKALETLRSTTIESGMDAARALVLAVEKERLIRGEPTDRTATHVEEIIKSEYARWMVPETKEDWDDDEPRPAALTEGSVAGNEGPENVAESPADINAADDDDFDDIDELEDDDGDVGEAP